MAGAQTAEPVQVTLPPALKAFFKPKPAAGTDTPAAPAAAAKPVLLKPQPKEAGSAASAAKEVKAEPASPKAKPSTAKAKPAVKPQTEKPAAQRFLSNLPRRKPATQVARTLDADAEADKMAAAIESAVDPSAKTTGGNVRLPDSVLQRKPSFVNKVLGLGPSRRLSSEDAARYAHIFAFQETGDFVRANAEIEKLGDDRLLGHVLSQRYLSRNYKASYDELAAWMRNYADHPGAQKIHALGQRRQPKGAAALPAPKGGRGVYGLYDFDVGQLATPYLEKTSGKPGTGDSLAPWKAGLDAWRRGDYPSAAKYFEQTATSGRASAWMSAAGAHWAARAWLRARQPQKVGYWLHRAADYPRTFYGIISMKALGMEQSKFNWQVPHLGEKHLRALAKNPAGLRALALIDAERPELAEAELGQMNPGGNAVLQEAMIALANHHGMPALALRMGSSFKNRDGNLYDAALYPDAPWAPPSGFSVDKALVYAFIRQESRFQPAASNKSSGATGLMQLMPDTARYVARNHGDNIASEKLQDPVLNIDLGQKYLAELLKNDKVDNNLFKLAVAYNAGPGKLARWEETTPYADDPLLFIESIPAAETRIFVERVLTNYWIYRIKYGQDTPSLEKVAQGDWPVYAPQDERGASVFAAAQDLFAP